MASSLPFSSTWKSRSRFRSFARLNTLHETAKKVTGGAAWPVQPPLQLTWKCRSPSEHCGTGPEWALGCWA